MRIDQALRSRDLLGAKLGTKLDSWKTWLTVLKATYGHKLTEAELATFRFVAGDRPPPSKRVRELWCTCGRRSGKTEVAAAIGAYHALIAPRRLSVGEKAFVIIVAADRAQARVCKDCALAYIKSSPV